jgi:cytochrome c biogenesis factor
MPSLGSALLALAFFTTIAAAAIALAGRGGDRRRIDLSRRLVYAVCALITACVAIIEIAFASDDFGFNIVAEHS